VSQKNAHTQKATFFQKFKTKCNNFNKTVIPQYSVDFDVLKFYLISKSILHITPKTKLEWVKNSYEITFQSNIYLKVGNYIKVLEKSSQYICDWREKKKEIHIFPKLCFTEVIIIEKLNGFSDNLRKSMLYQNLYIIDNASLRDHCISVLLEFSEIWNFYDLQKVLLHFSGIEFSGIFN